MVLSTSPSTTASGSTALDSSSLADSVFNCFPVLDKKKTFQSKNRKKNSDKNYQQQNYYALTHVAHLWCQCQLSSNHLSGDWQIFRSSHTNDEFHRSQEVCDIYVRDLSLNGDNKQLPEMLTKEQFWCCANNNCRNWFDLKWI